MNLWPHQINGIESVETAIAQGRKALCLTSPTGGGKSRMMTELIWRARDREQNVLMLTNRRMLLEQLEGVLKKEGINFTVRAAGYKTDQFSKVALSSVQTEISRVLRHETWELFPADLVLIDEAHQQASGKAQELIEAYKSAGAAVVGITATPIDLAHLYDHLVVAGVNSELRACGALVPCKTYGPDEPDSRNLKNRTKTGEYTEGDVRKAIMTPTIFARVLEWYERLNPDGRPAILFAPGVAESQWFAEQFVAHGISAAHIDGEEISYGAIDSDGQSQSVKTSPERREEILAGSREGRIKVLCNRFVLREGIDAPWLEHGIFATVFGGLSSYLQAGGRLLRAYPGISRVTVQDHGGNWHHHGSLNADRQWNLTWGNREYAAQREGAMREKKDPEPIRCPKCSAIRASGDTCMKCGHRQSRQSRMVVQTDGSLREMTGDIYKPRKTQERSDTQKLWDGIYWRCKKSGKTFSQAEGFFRRTYGYYPPRTLANMPVSDLDWGRKICDVGYSQVRRAETKDDPQRSLI